MTADLTADLTAALRESVGSGDPLALLIQSESERLAHVVEAWERGEPTPPGFEHLDEYREVILSFPD